MKCLQGAGAPQCTGNLVRHRRSQARSPRSAWNIQVVRFNLSSIVSKRRRIKWPPANMTSPWNQLDEYVNQILEAMVKGGADGKLQTVATIIVRFAAEQFKGETKGSKTP